MKSGYVLQLENGSYLSKEPAAKTTESLKDAETFITLRGAVEAAEKAAEKFGKCSVLAFDWNEETQAREPHDGYVYTALRRRDNGNQ